MKTKIITTLNLKRFFVVLVKKKIKRNSRLKNLRKRRKQIIKKGLSLLPNIFTLGNGFFGFCSIVFAAKFEFFAAAYFILLGALMDALDGRVARLVGASSLIGLQLDSLADAVSFCLAPAFLIYFWQLKYLGVLGLILSSIFFLCGILRLARFNVIAGQQTIFFLGLPTTIAGCFLAVFFLNMVDFHNDSLLLFFTLILYLVLSFLMISTIKFPAFKQKLFKLNKNWYKVAFIVLFAIIAVMQFQKVLLLLFLLYFSSAFVLFKRFKD
ncbi:CDP-diacylglycerol--serine O-phosphatidyltransferase [Candidatus Dependentiae bacterium]|nr:CDP-diacylglycerol--serine O-phosphatidyltransferase [Candidatus Dependentiae bacterium]